MNMACPSLWNHAILQSLQLFRDVVPIDNNNANEPNDLNSEHITQAPRVQVEDDDPSADTEEDTNNPRRALDKESLMREAISLTHLCTHLPKNPYCTACMRSKVNQRQRRPGPKKHYIEATKFGDSVTGDHLISSGKDGYGVDGEAVGWVSR